MISIIYDTLNPRSTLDWIQWGGIIGLLLFVIVGGARKWWVFGWQYRELEQRLEKVEASNSTWMQLALRGVNITEHIAVKHADDLSDW